jgi:hypothetical protein
MIYIKQVQRPEQTDIYLEIRNTLFKGCQENGTQCILEGIKSL